MAELTASQINAVRTFTGNIEDDIETWIDHVTRVQKGFTWTNDKTGQIAENKLIEKAAKWLEATKSLGNEFAGWDELKKALLVRFKRETSDVTAALAMGELQQGPMETVADFYDRCVLAMKKKNHRVPDALKADANFKEAVNTDLFVFFGGGLKKYIRNATICSSTPPADIEELLKAAKRVEMQTEAKDRLFELEETKQQDLNKGRTMEGTDEVQAEIEKLTEQLNVLKAKRRPQTYKPLECWTCGIAGHFSRNCRKRGQGQRNRGRYTWGRQGNYNRQIRREANEMIGTDEVVEEEFSLSGNE